MINAKDISLHFGKLSLFNNISFSLNKHEKIALIGKNGSGKTTLIKIIAQNISPDNGYISVEKHAKIAYLSQDIILSSKKNILLEAMTAHNDFKNAKEFVLQIENMIHLENDKIKKNDLLEKYSLAQQTLLDCNEKKLEAKTKKVLMGLGFDQDQWDKPVQDLSVGWKMRLTLAKLLLQKADFYLFDEPTNHLDIVSKDWFLSFLEESTFGYLLITHDRFFLEHACNKIFSLEKGNLRVYQGNYTQFLQEQKNEKMLIQKSYIEQQKEIKRKKEVIERFRAKASKAKMAKSMQRSLDKIEIINIEKQTSSMSFFFPSLTQSGEIVLKGQNLTKKFNSNIIFEDISFEVKRNEKIAIVAPNGKGKTTLLNIIANKISKDNGTISFGHNVSWSFFEQEQNRTLDPKKEIIREVEDICQTSEQRQRVRGLLGAFLFPGDDVHKKISVLSGGEKNRVAMVKVLLQSSNFLLLDEPTNHLDIQSKEILLQSLQQFPGTILFVSHDRDFLDKLSSHILYLNDKKIVKYEGNYESLLYQLKHQDKNQEDIVFNKTTIKTKKNGKEYRFKEKELKKIEKNIEKLEKEQKRIQFQFESIKYGTEDFERQSKRLKEIASEIKNLYDMWQKHEK